MLKTSLTTLLALVLITSQAYAGKVIKLSPKESKSLTNHSVWTVSATCSIKGGENKNKIVVSVTENKGSVNGKNLSKGQKTSVNVKNNDSISVSADPGTTVNLVNLGTDSVEAVCFT
jgi:hypothetical protein